MKCLDLSQFGWRHDLLALVNSMTGKSTSLAMFKNSSATSHCPEKGRPVCINQTEEQCRRQNGCEQDGCPLKADFMTDRLEDLLLTCRRA
jgi:hypothetical protein